MAVMEAERVIVNGRARYYEQGYKPLIEWVKSIGLNPNMMPNNKLFKFGPLVVAARILYTRKGRLVTLGNNVATRPTLRFTLKRLPAVPDA